jgi:hypothetical protein
MGGFREELARTRRQIENSNPLGGEFLERPSDGPEEALIERG